MATISPLIVAALFVTVKLEPASLGDAHLDGDRCETEAMQAYAEALRFCQLSRGPNPRLRCYEAAKAVYREKLQQCRATSGSGQ